MSDKDKAVNEEESAASATSVTEQDAEDTATATDEQEQTDQTVSTPKQGNADDDVDDRGIPWKNKAMELQRKLNETVDRLPQIVEETVSRYKQTPQAERKYTIEELERIAIDQPNLRPQVEAEKFKLMQERFEQTTDERIKAVDRKRQEETLRGQAEQWVVNHPEFKECFTTDMYGKKQWNMNSPLSQMVGTYLNDSELKTRPDGIAIAAKLALADHIMAVKYQSSKKTNAVKGELRNLQKKTLIEGGTTNPSSGSSDALTKAKNNLAKSGSKQDAQDAIKAYLKKAGHI
jgi:hypothetical protein